MNVDQIKLRPVVHIFAGVPRCPSCNAWLELHDSDMDYDFWFCLPPKGQDCGVFPLPKRHWTVRSW